MKIEDLPVIIKVLTPLTFVRQAYLVYCSDEGTVPYNAMTLELVVDKLTFDDFKDTKTILDLLSSKIASQSLEDFTHSFYHSYRNALRSHNTDLAELTREYRSRDYHQIEVISPNVTMELDTFILNIHLDDNYVELFDKVNWSTVLSIPLTLSNNSITNYIRKPMMPIVQ